MYIYIEKNDGVEFAKICAQLAREGVTFEARDRGNGEYIIELTGGF